MSLLPPLEDALTTAIAAQPRRRRVPARVARVVVPVIGVLATATAAAAPSGLLGRHTPAPQSDVRLKVLGTNRTAALADYRGKIVVVSFYASWCTPCREQARRLSTLRADGVVTVLIASRDRGADALQAIATDGVTLPVLADPDQTVGSHYHLVGYPTTFVLDRSGAIVSVDSGLVDTTELRAAITAAKGPR